MTPDCPSLGGARVEGLGAGRCMCFMRVESPVMIIVRGRIKLDALLVGKRRKVREKSL